METILLQIKDHKVYKLLENLADLNLITVLEKSEKSYEKLSDKYAGKLSSSVADELQEYVKKSRNEWNDKTI